MINTVYKTKLYTFLKENNSEFLPKINDAIKYAEDMLPLINNVFTTYTVHGIKHSINVMEYMYSLISDIHKLSELEVVLLIYSALFHDIGMIINEKEIIDIKEEIINLGGRKYSKVLEKYKDDKIALQECIRPVHGERAKKHIQEMDEKLFLIPNSTTVSFRDEIGLICMSHNEDFEWIEKNLMSYLKKGHYDVNLQYISILLRISDYLDIDEQRAPLYLYRYLQPQEYSELEWKQHFVIENYDKIISNKKTGLKEIIFEGKSQEPSVHRKLLKYFESLNGEIKNAIRLSETFEDEKYLLLLKSNIINKIQTQGFSFSDLKLSLNYNAVTNLLMGENIYGDKKYGLRELIQNSIDACKTMLETSFQMEEFRYTPYQPNISIVLDKDRKQVMIIDNGSGMSINILKNYFLNVGVSYYTSDEYLLQGRKYSPIGHYGIGFLACFMLSDKVEVKTRHYKEQKMNRISFEKDSEYICLTYEKDNRRQGTEIILDYEQFLSAFDNKIQNIVYFIEKNFIDSSIPIKLSLMEKGKSNYINCTIKAIDTLLQDSICLNTYLNDIEVYIDCTFRQINFASCLKNINGCDSYFYDKENNSMKEENAITIKDCVNEDGEIVMMNIPIIQEEESENFLKAYDVLEDYDMALKKIDNYELINIWANDEIIPPYYISASILSDSIIGNYTFEDFSERFEHSISVPLEAGYVKQKVIVNDFNMVLPYNENCMIYKDFRYEGIDKAYIKNVLLPNFSLKVPFLVDGIVLKGSVININNKDFIPNVSRNNLSVIQQQELEYAIGKAIHLWVKDNISLNNEHKKLLDSFIKTKYSNQNKYLK